MGKRTRSIRLDDPRLRPTGALYEQTQAIKDHLYGAITDNELAVVGVRESKRDVRDMDFCREIDQPPAWWDKYKETDMYKTNEDLSREHRERLDLTTKDDPGLKVSFRLKPGTTEKGFALAWDRLTELAPDLFCLVPEIEAPTILSTVDPYRDEAVRGIIKKTQDYLYESPPEANFIRKWLEGVIRTQSDPAPGEADAPESPASPYPEDPSDRDMLQECSCLLLYSLSQSFDQEEMDQFRALVRRVLPLLSQPSGPSRLWRALVEVSEELVQCDLSDASSGPSLCPSGSPEGGIQIAGGTPGLPPGPSRDH